MVIRMAGIRKIIILSNRYEVGKYGFDYLRTYEYLSESLFHELDIRTLENERKLLPFQLAEMNMRD